MPRTSNNHKCSNILQFDIVNVLAYVTGASFHVLSVDGATFKPLTGKEPKIGLNRKSFKGSKNKSILKI